MKNLIPLVIAPLLFSIIFVSCSGKEQDTKLVAERTATLKTMERGDLLHFNSSWFIVLQNYPELKHIQLRCSLLRDTYVTLYYTIVKSDDFEAISGRALKEDPYVKTLLVNFLGI